jgi:glycosyltransferase involved in cell wall biosynthesis
MKIAYLMSRFPKLTETFVLYEMRAVEQLGVQVEVFPLLRAKATSRHPEGTGLLAKIVERMTPSRGAVLMHDEARPFVERAHYAPFLSSAILAANWRVFRRTPRRYLRALAALVVDNLGSLNLLVGGLAIFPKAIYFGELMRGLSVEHVHAHFANHPATAAWIIHATAGITYSFTGHGADLQVDQHMLCRKVRDARAVVTISDYNRTFITEHCGPRAAQRVTVIRCGVDLATVDPKPETGIMQNPIELLCVGTFYEVKGHRYLIDACRILAERGRSVRCRLVGEGPDRAVLQRQVNEAQLDGVVVFDGPKARTEVLDAMRRADMLVLPSVPTASGRREGLPVVLMEAMASGLPVIATAISGIPELVRDRISGLLVPPRDPRAIADAVEQLADDRDLRKRLAAAGRRAVELDFDLMTNADRLIGLLATREV